ncbi:MAG: rRNA pseudouridine synthase [Rhodospirillales bacterium]|nr:rRNA pseudouridine synthase [Rhodospirillales bacterium]
MEPQRVAKLIARAGVCSRRDAERLIAEGRVKLDGKVLDTPAVVVDDPRRIQVDNKPLSAPEKTRLWRYHKPSGLVTTARDPEGRPTVFERLPKDLPRVISVGRLDLTSEGLLLLTNDGALARHLELPATGWVRRYRVRVHGMVDPAKLAQLAKGVTIEGIRYGAVEAVLEREKGLNAWLVMGLTEGRNREVRRLCEWMGLQVTRLIRVSYGPFQLGLLPRGEVEEVPPRVLRDQLGFGAKGGGEEKPRPDQSRAERKGPEHRQAGPGRKPRADRRR